MISKQSSWAIFKKLGMKSRRLVEGLEIGEYRSAFRGQGVEFKEVRPYQWGDDLRQMEWNVTARMGAPYVKELVEERELTLVAVLDVSRSMNFGTRVRLKSDLAAEVVSLLAFLALSHRDRFGALLFGGTALRFLPPGKGEKHTLSVLKRMEGAFSGESRLEDALFFLSRVLKRKSYFFIVSDFLDSFPDARMKVAACRHSIFPFVISDPAEWELPQTGSLFLKDAETGETLLADTGSAAVRNAYRLARRTYYDRMQEKFSRLGVRGTFFSTGTPPFQTLAGFLRRLSAAR